MNRPCFPRRRYTVGATPIEFLGRLSRHLGGPDIYAKRDDLTGLAAGGNKTRKLEFLVGDALEKGCDTLITIGAVQSNHCRLTLAAAAQEGLKCRLILREKYTGEYQVCAGGNNLLFDLLGVEDVLVLGPDDDSELAMTKVVAALEREGRRGYTIPIGGSNSIGSLGYVACAAEIISQAGDLNIAFDHIICANGSAGTQAGLLAGLRIMGGNIPITGINVRCLAITQRGITAELAQSTMNLLGVPLSIPSDSVITLDEWLGNGYAVPTPDMVEAVRLVGGIEGILLDPVYSGKAMAGLIGMIRQGEFKKGQSVLFMHTGGTPALHVYQNSFRSQLGAA